MHAAGRGGLHVGRRQPGVEGKHGHLDGKGDGHGQEGPALEAEGIGLGRQLGNRERAARDVERHHGDQQQGAAGQGVEEELERGVAALRPAPHGDEQEHGDQHGLPENVEQDKIKGDEHPDAGRGHEHEAEVELLDPLADVGPGAQHAQRQQQHGQEHHQQADAVHAQVVGQPPRPDPLGLFLELVAGKGQVEAEQRQRAQEFHDAHREGEHPHGPVPLDERQDQAGRHGKEDQDRQCWPGAMNHDDSVPSTQ